MMNHMITIGQLATYAGVTIKAVRHYHQRGLLAEPPRDSSGYRRYSAQHAIDLVKIKTLAEAGVPLARINELLAADPDRFAAAIAEIDRNLQERATELLRTRERIAQLGAGDRLFVSAEVADYLDRLHELGVSQRTVQMERDGWILAQAVSPHAAATWIADKRDAIDDPEFQAIYLLYDAAFDSSLAAWTARERGATFSVGSRRPTSPESWVRVRSETSTVGTPRVAGSERSMRSTSGGIAHAPRHTKIRSGRAPAASSRPRSSPV